jgi:hypothetical protein
MSRKSAKFTQTDANRLFRAAVKVGIEVRVEFRPDGTIIASTGNSTTRLLPEDVNGDLDTWIKKHHAD